MKQILILIQLEKEFLKKYGCTENYEKNYIENEGQNKNEIINNIYNHTNSWEWKFGETPEFTNSLQHKFDFGLLDLSVKVEKGVIVEAVFYSDTLYSEFIDILNNYLKSSGIRYTYDLTGLSELRRDLSIILKNNEDYHRFNEKMWDEFIHLI